MRHSVSKWFAAAMLVITLLGSCQKYAFHGTPYESPGMAPEFELANVKGGTYRLSNSKGQIVLIYFGYTTCPDICPGTLAQARQMYDLLGEHAKAVEYLFVTVDPERDTPEVMSAYVSAFSPRIIGLTGSAEVLDRVFEAYGIVAEKEVLPNSAVGYMMNHTTRVFLVDQEGRLRLSYVYGTIAEDMVDDIRHLLD